MSGRAPHSEPARIQQLLPDGTVSVSRLPLKAFTGPQLISLDCTALADRAEFVHVKAHHVDHDGAVGPVDLPKALGILCRHGYSDPITIEYEAPAATPGPIPAA